MKFIGTLLDDHFHRYPRMQPADIYKLLHQAALGSGHAMDCLGARARLDAEVAAMGAGPKEPLVDVISPDGRLGRVHLRPYVEQGRSLDHLAEAFVRTANDHMPAPDKLEKFCACLGDLAAAKRIPFNEDVVIGFVADIARQGYPIVHHSSEYRTAYRPAYRIVLVELLSGV